MRVENCTGYFQCQFFHTIVFKFLILVIVSFCALLMYRKIDSLAEIKTVPPKSVLKRTLLKFHNLAILRNVTSEKSVISKELEEISQFVQNKLERLQNTVVCSAPHVVCGHRSNCGFGCHVHHRMYCLMLSFATNRSLIFNNHRYLSYKTKWEDVFQEIGVPCRGNRDALIVDWGTHPTSIMVRRKKKHFPSPVMHGFPFPQDLISRLQHVHLKPFLWLMGQFAKFVLKILPGVEGMIEESIKNIGFDDISNSPIVGVHIRRTDKLKEQPGAYHPLTQYMEEASNYFKEFHPNIQTKRIFLATEDLNAYEEIKNLHQMPEWKVLGFKPQKTTGNLTERTDYLFEILRDVVILSRCEFVVCGFSSNICRLAYELMQTKNEDATTNVISLDKMYYYNVLGSQLKLKLINERGNSTKIL